LTACLCSAIPDTALGAGGPSIQFDPNEFDQRCAPYGRDVAGITFGVAAQFIDIGAMRHKVRHRPTFLIFYFPSQWFSADGSQPTVLRRWFSWAP